MEESQKFFESTAGRDDASIHEPDRTLVTPRFDEVEAQVARPVVPLANRPARSSSSGRRQWPIALVLISALAGGVVSLLAFRMYQQRQAQAVATEAAAPASATGNAQSSAPSPAGALATTEQQAQSDAPVVFEEFDPAKEGGAVSDAAPSLPRATAATAATAATTTATTAASTARPKDEPRDEPKPAPRAAEPKPRLVETISSPRRVEARQEEVHRNDRRADVEDFGDSRRERRRERREQRREQRRNIDRIKDIFEGAPPS